jgi:exopolyphosphatase/guanosine-5'-triphosphate,3'-diphosphate pyrophosphatase
MMHGSVDQAVWEEMKAAVKRSVKGLKSLAVIGSGGNINKLFSISKVKNNGGLAKVELDAFLKELSGLSVTERMHRYNLRQERAEVIVPALQVYTSILKWAAIDSIEVPRIGLADGLIRELYYQ